MIYFPDKKVCFMEKPKCGSTSLSRSLSQQIGSKIVGKSILDCKNYEDINYRHANLNNCVKKLKELGLNYKEFTFLVILREPVDLVSSMFYFEQNNTKRNNKYFQFNTLDEMMETVHYQYFVDSNYFNNEYNVNLVTFTLDKLNLMVEYVKTNYQIKLQIGKINETKNRQTLNLSLTQKEQVTKDFYLYYEANHGEI